MRGPCAAMHDTTVMTQCKIVHFVVEVGHFVVRGANGKVNSVGCQYSNSVFTVE